MLAADRVAHLRRKLRDHEEGQVYSVLRDPLAKRMREWLVGHMREHAAARKRLPRTAPGWWDDETTEPGDVPALSLEDV